MNRSLSFAPYYVAFVALASIAPAHAECNLQLLAPNDSKITVGATTVLLGEADEPSQASAWQGPLRAGACTFDVGIIEQPIALAPSQLMYVTTYTGSLRTVSLFDLKTCTVRWKSAPFAGVVALTPTALKMGGKSITLDSRCVPALPKKRK
jgi:hypothetical protein